jgi:hypothetical protein
LQQAGPVRGVSFSPDVGRVLTCGDDTTARIWSADTGLPPIRDMAQLQFGASHCQIAGTYVPVADFNLAAADHLYFNHHVLLWKEPRTLTPRLPLKGWWRRLLAGLPLVMLQARGPGRIAFSKDAPPKTGIRSDRGPGRRKAAGAFFVASPSVAHADSCHPLDQSPTSAPQPVVLSNTGTNATENFGKARVPTREAI